jgi:DNA polymerase-4
MPTLVQRAAKHIETRRIDKIGVKIKFSDFRQTTKEHKSSDINQAVLIELLSQAWERRNGKDARLLGIFIGFGDTQSDNEAEQLMLAFDLDVDDQKSLQVNHNTRNELDHK